MIVLASCWSMLFVTRTVREFTWKPSWEVMSRVNSRAMSTFDASSTFWRTRPARPRRPRV